MKWFRRKKKIEHKRQASVTLSEFMSRSFNPHTLSNSIINQKGNEAVVEAYILPMTREGQDPEAVYGVRIIDEFNNIICNTTYKRERIEREPSKFALSKIRQDEEFITMMRDWQANNLEMYFNRYKRDILVGKKFTNGVYIEKSAAQ